MKLSVFYHHVKGASEQTGLSLSAVLRRFRLAGIEQVEIEVTDATDETRELLKDEGFRVGGMPTWFRFLDRTFDPADTRYLERPLAMGATHLLILPEHIEVGHDWARTRNRLIEGVSVVAGQCRAAGLIPCIENFDDLRSSTCRMDDLGRYFESIPALGFNLDTGNFAMVEADPLEALERYGTRVVAIHAKDRTWDSSSGGGSKRTQGGKAFYSCPVGTGFVPMRALLEKIGTKRQTVPIAIECYDVPNLLEAVLDSAAFLRSMESGD